MKRKENKTISYGSIEQMQQRKEQLHEVISLENKEIRRLWTQLTSEDKHASRGEQIATFVSYGVMAYDGVMMLRIQQKPVSPSTENAIKEITTFLGMLSDYYKEDKEKGLKFEDDL